MGWSGDGKRNILWGWLYKKKCFPKKPFNCTALHVSSIPRATSGCIFFRVGFLISSPVENKSFQVGNKVEMVHST